MTYEWDAENRLEAVKQGGNTLASFTYDGHGRRATKTAGGITSSFVYDGPQFLEERPGAGTAKRYVYGFGIDRPLAQAVGGVTSYFLADHLGSIAQVTDNSGTPTLTREYDPWGNLLQGSSTGGYAFTGREWDAETNLYYYRARYYDSATARFLGEDPLGHEADVNLYRYAANSPVLRVDPSGLETVVIIVSDHSVPSHAALFITEGPMLYDPAGNVYQFGRRPSNDIFLDDEANVLKYTASHMAQGSTVELYRFCTSRLDELRIWDRAAQLGSGGLIGCATQTSAALTGIGPFEDLHVSVTPSGLRSEVLRIKRQGGGGGW
jgi:RHS repeat-associated protein